MPGQFSDFFNSLDADPLKRGKQFEHFVKWFLKADPEWSTQVDHVWLWDECAESPEVSKGEASARTVVESLFVPDQ